MFRFQQKSRKFIHSFLWIELMLVFLAFYLFNIDNAYAQNISIKIFSDNSVVKIDSILRIDKGIEARLYEYKTDQSSDLPPESKLLNAGLEESSKKQFEKAIKLYTKALQFNSVFAKAYVSRAYARSQVEQIEKAFEDYNQAIEIEPNLADAYIGRGNLYFKQGENESALRDFDLAITVNKNYYDAYFSRGSVYLQLEKYQDAIKDFSEAIDLNPQYLDAYTQRG